MDFWLNEGWTTYLERRLQAAVFGEAHRDFSAIIGWKALQDSVHEFRNNLEFTKMIPDLNGRDPDDAFSSVPYEKGYTFLSYLEGRVCTFLGLSIASFVSPMTVVQQRLRKRTGIFTL